MNYYHRFVENVSLRRWTVLLFLCGVLFLLRSMMTIILLTFIFTYLMYKLVQLIRKKVNISTKILSIFIYLLVVALVYLVITKYVPVILEQSAQLIKSVTNFYQKTDSNNELLEYVLHFVQTSDYVQRIQSGVLVVINYLYNFGELALTVLISFLLSFFFMIDHQKTVTFSRLFLQGSAAWFFEDVYYLASKFTRAFGSVIETQLLIAIVNTVITVLALATMGFPQLLSLALMIFFLSLIPVAGVIISCIPLTFIAYTVGGLNDVLYILLIIIFVHALESYVLNPRLMSHKTEIPMFYTFIVLYLGEHLFGIWGLIVGIPIFTFLLDLMKIKQVPSIKIPMKKN
jgi:predicted PurR-regulated permease PerM